MLWFFQIIRQSMHRGVEVCMEKETSYSWGPKIQGQTVYSDAAGKNVTLSVYDPRKPVFTDWSNEK